ncbi:hypothetical protein ACFL6Y_10975 [Elusimicrobiota bacterium]
MKKILMKKRGGGPFDLAQDRQGPALLRKISFKNRGYGSPPEFIPDLIRDLL